jgi:hypothetical protein
MVGAFLAARKRRLEAEKNRKRLEGAALVSRKLGALRVADLELRRLTARLVYEADLYINSCGKIPEAWYEPSLLDALDRALAGLNVFLRRGNEAAAEKHFPLDGADEAGGGNPDGLALTRALLRDLALMFIRRREVSGAGDMDAVIAAPRDDFPGTAGER